MEYSPTHVKALFGNKS